MTVRRGQNGVLEALSVYGRTGKLREVEILRLRDMSLCLRTALEEALTTPRTVPLTILHDINDAIASHARMALFELIINSGRPSTIAARILEHLSSGSNLSKALHGTGIKCSTVLHAWHEAGLPGDSAVSALVCHRNDRFTITRWELARLCPEPQMDAFQLSPGEARELVTIAERGFNGGFELIRKVMETRAVRWRREFAATVSDAPRTAPSKAVQRAEGLTTAAADIARILDPASVRIFERDERQWDKNLMPVSLELSTARRIFQLSAVGWSAHEIARELTRNINIVRRCLAAMSTSLEQAQKEVGEKLLEHLPYRPPREARIMNLRVIGRLGYAEIATLARPGFDGALFGSEVVSPQRIHQILDCTFRKVVPRWHTGSLPSADALRHEQAAHRAFEQALATYAGSDADRSTLRTYSRNMGRIESNLFPVVLERLGKFADLGVRTRYASAIVAETIDSPARFEEALAICKRLDAIALQAGLYSCRSRLVGPYLRAAVQGRLTEKNFSERCVLIAQSRRQIFERIPRKRGNAPLLSAVMDEVITRTIDGGTSVDVPAVIDEKDTLLQRLRQRVRDECAKAGKWIEGPAVRRFATRGVMCGKARPWQRLETAIGSYVNAVAEVHAVARRMGPHSGALSRMLAVRFAGAATCQEERALEARIRNAIGRYESMVTGLREEGYSQIFAERTALSLWPLKEPMATLERRVNLFSEKAVSALRSVGGESKVVELAVHARRIRFNSEGAEASLERLLDLIPNIVGDERHRLAATRLARREIVGGWPEVVREWDDQRFLGHLIDVLRGVAVYARFRPSADANPRS